MKMPTAIQSFAVAATLRVYGVAAWLAQPLLRRKLRRRAVAEPGYAEHVEERFGRYDDVSDVRGLLWIHAVSLGETRAAAILATALRHLDPTLRLLLTNGTATGRAEGLRWLKEGDIQVWQPWDAPGAVARFLDRFMPRIGVLMETEVWPNLTLACAKRGIPLVLANARLSEKTFAAADRHGWLARAIYGRLTAAWAQSAGDAVRLGAIGAPVDGIFGNLKFDATPDAALLSQGRRWRAAQAKPVLLLASSREGEELALLQAMRRLRDAPEAQGTGIHLLIVPRHPQRFDAVAQLIVSEGFRVARRSETAGFAESTPPSSEANIWLGDSLGEMALYYGLADVALLGGSFEPLGGQNLIEAAACGCPLLMGPSTFNFSEAAELALDAGAALRVGSMETALATAFDLIEAPARLAAMAEAAQVFAAAHCGAAERTARAVLALAHLPANDKAALSARAGV